MNDFDAYARWLKIPADRRPPNYYDLLGLPALESDGARIRKASMERTAYVRRFCLGQHGAEATKLLGELAAAFSCLLDPAAKAVYDDRLTAEIGPAAHGAVTRGMSSPGDAPLALGNSADQEDDIRPPPIIERKKRAGGRLLPAAQLSAARRRRRGKFPARLASAASLALVLLMYAGYRWHALTGGDTALAKVALVERQETTKEPIAKKSATPARPRNQSASGRHPARVEQPMAESAPAKPQSRPTAPSQPSTSLVDDAAAPLTDAPPQTDTPVPNRMARDEMEPGGVSEREREEMESEAAAIAAPIPDFSDNDIPETRAPRDETPADPPPAANRVGDTGAIDDGPLAADQPPPDGEPPPSDGPPEPFSAGQVVGPMDSNGADGKFWRARAAGRQQEWVELWFPRPVAASFLQLYLVEQPVTLDHIIIYPTTGEPIKMLPKRAPVDLFRSLLFTFGVHPIETRHIKLVMHSPRAERVEIDAVALLTKSQERFWPEAAQVRTTFNQPADSDGPMFDEESLDAGGHDAGRDSSRK